MYTEHLGAQQLLERASDSPEELLELLKQENEHMKQYIATVDAEQVGAQKLPLC